MEDLLNKKEMDLINKLAQLELVASHSYLYLSTCMMSKGYFGAQKFFMGESSSEIEHFNKWGKFVNDMGLEIDIPKVEAVDIELDGLEDALEAALEMETDLLKKYEDACSVDVSMKVKLILYDFINIQIEAVGEYSDLLVRIGETKEPILIDQELGK